MKQLRNFDTYFFFSVLFLATAGVFILVLPFASAVFVAALFALMFSKSYKINLKLFKSQIIASLFSCFFVAFTIVLPFTIVGGLVSNEISDLATNFTNGKTALNQEKIENFVSSIYEFEFFNVSLGQLKKSFSEEEMTNFFKNSVVKFLTYFQETYKSVVNGIIWIFVMFFTLFYFFIDGKRFVKKLMSLSPMKDRHEQLLINKFVSMTRATLKGTLIIGSIQGLIGGFSFWIAGISSPAIWAVIMIIFSIIPATGASLVLIPAAIIMFILGNIWQSIFLLTVGISVSFLDNFLRPRLVGNDTQIHGLLVFFATLGGLKVFGLIGFIVGPIIMALGIALWEIYAVEFKQDLKLYNEG